MTQVEFTEVLRRLCIGDIRAIAASLETDTAGDEVDLWRATIAIDRALRHSHRTRLAAHAAWDAAQSVQRAAEAQGVELPDRDVTRVARAAAEIARGIVAGDEVAAELGRLLQHWFPVLART